MQLIDLSSCLHNDKKNYNETDRLLKYGEYGHCNQNVSQEAAICTTDYAYHDIT